jgi:hypothetical protein
MKKIVISVLALTLAVLLASPATAVTIDPYASMRLGTYWVSHDFNDFQPSWTTDSSDDSLMIDIADISRFGAKGQIGDIYGVVEIGLVGQENKNEYTWYAYGGNNNMVYTRLIYGRWDFGAGKLTVGQDYTPVTFPSQQQGPGIFDDSSSAAAPGDSYDVQNGSIGVGCLWDSRIPQIKLNLDNGFYFVVAQNDDGTPQGSVAGGDIDLNLPKMMIGYEFKGENFYIAPGFAYQSYKYTELTSGYDNDINSYILYVHGKVDLTNVNFRFTGHYGQNLGDYAITGRANRYSVSPTTGTGFNPAKAYWRGDSIDDSTGFGGYFTCGIPVPIGSLNLGWGYSSDENDTDAVAGATDADELMGYFFNWKIPIADMFTCTPEVGFWDGMDDAFGQKDPDTWYLGATWQIDF